MSIFHVKRKVAEKKMKPDYSGYEEVEREYVELSTPRVIAAAVGGFVTLLLLLIYWPLTAVGAGHVGVMTRFGAVQQEVLGEGLHLINPLNAVRELNVQVQKVEVEGDAASKDLQQVTTNIALNYHLNPKTAAQFYQHIGMQYEDRAIQPAIQETFKAVTAQYSAEDLVAKREDVRTKIRTVLSAKLQALTEGGVVVDDFSITNFKFSKEFNQAIESKQQAEQLALKAQRDLQRIRTEAEQKVVQAQAEATSLKLQKQEITPELLQLRQIEVQRAAIYKWDGKLPNVSGGAMPFINVGK